MRKRLTLSRMEELEEWEGCSPERARKRHTERGRLVEEGEGSQRQVPEGSVAGEVVVDIAREERGGEMSSVKGWDYLVLRPTRRDTVVDLTAEVVVGGTQDVGGAVAEGDGTPDVHEDVAVDAQLPCRSQRRSTTSRCCSTESPASPAEVVVEEHREAEEGAQWPVHGGDDDSANRTRPAGQEEARMGTVAEGEPSLVVAAAAYGAAEAVGTLDNAA